MVVRLRRIDPNEWKSIGVKALEANAMVVVRSQEHRSVIAGPGAGKTELLAQRAAYLLQTGISPIPQRILAISFKKSAASNLADRVSQRCEKTQAARFDSLTFDAFAKSLVDRFGQALPERWRPRPDYEILFPNFRMYDNFVRRTLGAPPDAVGTYRDIQAISTKAFEKIYLVGSRLPENDFENPTPAQWAADQFWQSSLHGGKKSFLSFPMIGRLAELLLRISPMARDALRLTYSHLFMDEFQDTTPIQYDLMHTIFSGSDTVVTAVGDNKQQIMRWALAMDTPFTVFDQDFSALPTPLFNNYRSSPELVRIQHVLAQALDAKAAEPVSMTEDTINGDTHSWTEALDDYEGKDAVPLMTVHKAKGLEYHTVIFIGLDDGAWWSFAQDQIEGTAGFFVAFTRAKQRVVFTYCARRGTRTGIATLYDLLQQAGVNINVIK